MHSRDIFISHAAVDEKIASAIVDTLLGLGMGLSLKKQVFYTSRPETGIAPGEDFDDVIKEHIQNPKIVLLLVTQNYLTRPYCLAEAGAAWAKSLKTIPILVPPLTFQDIQGALRSKQFIEIQSESGWHSVLQHVKNILQIDPDANQWTRNLETFLRAMKGLIKKQPSPPHVSLDSHKKIVAQLAGANSQIDELEEECERLQKVNKALLDTNDHAQRIEILLRSMPAQTQLKSLSKEVQDKLASLPSGVYMALFFHFRNEKFFWRDVEEEGLTRDVTDAVRRDYLSEDEDGVAVNESQPKVEAAIKTLRRMRNWVKSTALNDEQFVAAYRKEHGHTFEFTNREFWDANF